MVKCCEEKYPEKNSIVWLYFQLEISKINIIELHLSIYAAFKKDYHCYIIKLLAQINIFKLLTKYSSFGDLGPFMVQSPSGGDVQNLAFAKPTSPIDSIVVVLIRTSAIDK